MRIPPTTHVLFGFFAAVALAHGGEDDRPEAKPDSSAPKAEAKPAERLSMTRPVACRSIEGYGSYEPLPDAALTADEKLLVYYHPLNYRVAKTGGSHHIHLAQSGQIRRRGQKAVLLRKENLLDYEIKVDYPPNPIFLRNTVSLKGLKPGEYDYDIILYDKHAPSQVARQTLPFRVVEAALPKEESSAEPAKETP